MRRVGEILPPSVRGCLEGCAEALGADWGDARHPGRHVRRVLRARIPWPEADGTDMPPAAEKLLALPVGGLPVLRLGYVLHGLPFATACAVAYACACACRELWLADLVPAERNLGLAAALAVRALPGLRPWGSASAVGRDWLAHGGLEGCLYGAGLRCLSRRTLLGGAALLARCVLPWKDGAPCGQVRAEAFRGDAR
ncbi:hypothetical protein [uncultured Desulfovibrio sp.]|uniref:hypothetical protein n=1 Tax=uncultured Desulfovibrio sp. TaxID=167968 RepID=UPI00261A178B|nr:hypothetical protein [uncultured Desulfovibrio sp.]